MVRAKFTVQSLNGNRVVLAPQYDNTIPEDQRYSKATPSGRLEMTIDNPLALAQFKIGQAFYLDFTPVQ